MLQFSLYAEVKQYMERGVYLENADRDRKRIVRRSAEKFIVQGKYKKISLPFNVLIIL